MAEAPAGPVLEVTDLHRVFGAQIAVEFYPLATLPGWMRAIAYGLPRSRRCASSSRATLRASALALSGALALVELALAARVFAATHRRALASGLIARYAAETVS